MVFNRLDMKAVQAYEHGANVVTAMPSKTVQKSAGLRCFAMESLNVGYLMTLYYKSLIYSDFQCKNSKTKLNGKGWLNMGKEHFKSGPIDLHFEKTTMWTVSRPESSVQYINEPLYISRDQSSL